MLVFETVQGLAYFDFVEGHDRLAIVFLVAGVDQRVQRERVILGGGDFFLDEGA